MKAKILLICLVLLCLFTLAACGGGGGGGGGGGSSSGTGTGIVGVWKIADEYVSTEMPAGTCGGWWLKSDNTVSCIWSSDNGTTWTYSDIDDKVFFAGKSYSYYYKCGTYTVSESNITVNFKNGETFTSPFQLSGDTFKLLQYEGGGPVTFTRINATPTCAD